LLGIFRLFNIFQWFEETSINVSETRFLEKNSVG
jgi:hypothetical protein